MKLLEQQAAEGEIDGISLADLASQYSTPAYIYSASAIRTACKRAQDSIAVLPDAKLSYAVKANGNLALLAIIAHEGLGFDVGSLGELERVESAAANCGLTPRMCFTGPCKTEADINAAVAAELDAIICESDYELERIEAAAKAAECVARIGVRVNPDIDANTHPHIATGLRETKFGVPGQDAVRMMARAEKSKHLDAAVLHCHIGSQISDSKPLIAAAQAMLDLRSQLAGKASACALDLGGGFGIGDSKSRPEANILAELAAWLKENAPDVSYAFQPGRSIVGQAGILLARVEYVKGDHVLVDAGMNDLLRPALYDAHHPVVKVGSGKVAGAGKISVAGPVCESGDYLARSIDLDAKPGDLLAIGDAGAYGFVMASNYNGRQRSCELVIDECQVFVARRRETVSDMLALERFFSPGA